MRLSIDMFNSRAPVWIPYDMGRGMDGVWNYEWTPMGGMCCFDGFVIADDRKLPIDDRRPILALEHANSNFDPIIGTVSCGPEVGCIYAD